MKTMRLSLLTLLALFYGLIGYVHTLGSSTAMAQQCQLFVECYEGGSVQVGNELIHAENRTIDCKQGQKFTLTVTPDPGYVLDFILEDEDIIGSRLVDNQLEIVMDRTKTIYIAFVQPDYTFEQNGVYYQVQPNSTEVWAVRGEKLYAGDLVLPDIVTYQGQQYQVTKVADRAFLSNPQLTSLTMSDIRAIGYNAFSDCPALQLVDLERVNEIEYDAFLNCSNISIVKMHAEQAPSFDYELFDKSVQAHTLQVPLNAIESYKQTYPWNQFATIEESTFDPAKSILVLTTYGPGTVTYEGMRLKKTAYSFAVENGKETEIALQCDEGAYLFLLNLGTRGVCADVVDNRYSFVMPQDDAPLYLTVNFANPFYHFEVDGKYYQYAENDEVALSDGEKPYTGDFVVPATVTYQGQEYRVTEVAPNAFSMWSGLTSVDLNQVETIYSSGFQMCNGLKSVKMPHVKRIDDYAFLFCDKLESVDFSAVETIGQQAFRGCTGLKSVNLPNVSVVSNAAFAFCEGLTSVDCGHTAMLYPNAFYSCTGLTDVNLRNVKSISPYAFSFCNSLKTIRTESKHLSLFPDAFDSGTMENATVYVPVGTQGYYRSAENWDKMKHVVEDNPVYLTVKQADDGQVILPVGKNMTRTVWLDAAEGWHIHQVLFDGKDVTTQLGADNSFTTPRLLQDALLSVVFEEGTPSGIGTVEDDALSVSGQQGQIVIEGAAENLPVRIYDLSGRQLVRTFTEAAKQSFSLPGNQVYVVQVGTRTFKLAL